MLKAEETSGQILLILLSHHPTDKSISHDVLKLTGAQTQLHTQKPFRAKVNSYQNTVVSSYHSSETGYMQTHTVKCQNDADHSPQHCYVYSDGGRMYSLAQPISAGFGLHCSALTRRHRSDAEWPWLPCLLSEITLVNVDQAMFYSIGCSVADPLLTHR